MVVAVLAAVQLGVLVLYRAIESGRDADEARFSFERLDRAAPDVALTGPGGRATRLGDHRGRPVLLHFWATWCPPCVDELPGLLDAAGEHEGELVLLAVSLDEDWAAVERFFDGSVPASVWRLADPEAYGLYDVVDLPDTFLIGADGRIRGRYGGERDWTSAGARAHLERVVAE